MVMVMIIAVETVVAGVTGASVKIDDEYYEKIKEKSMAVGLLKRANTNMYRDLLTNIRDQHG